MLASGCLYLRPQRRAHSIAVAAAWVSRVHEDTVTNGA